MKSLKGYSAEKAFDRDGNTSQDDVYRQFEDARQKYGHMNENELLSELKRQIDEQKRSGSYSKERINAYVEALQPYLSDEQRKRLTDILGEL